MNNRVPIAAICRDHLKTIACHLLRLMLLSESRILSAKQAKGHCYMTAPSFSINRCEIRSAQHWKSLLAPGIAATCSAAGNSPVKPQRSMHPLFPYFLTSLLPYFLWQFCRLHRIAHQQRNGHRPTPPGTGVSAPRIRHIRVHVTDQHISLVRNSPAAPENSSGAAPLPQLPSPYGPTSITAAPALIQSACLYVL